jgi:hypothetical protein
MHRRSVVRIRGFGKQDARLHGALFEHGLFDRVSGVPLGMLWGGTRSGGIARAHSPHADLLSNTYPLLTYVLLEQMVSEPKYLSAAGALCMRWCGLCFEMFHALWLTIAGEIWFSNVVPCSVCEVRPEGSMGGAVGSNRL